MASAHNSSEYVEELSNWYGEDVVAAEENFPGIFKPSKEEHELLGEVDLMVSEGGDPESLRAYEIKEAGSLNQRSILHAAFRAKDQCDNMENYFNDLEGYELTSAYIIKPEEHLKAVYEIWDELPEVFTLDDAKDTVSEPGRIPYLEREVLEGKEDKMYTIDESLTALFETEIVQP